MKHPVLAFGMAMVLCACSSGSSSSPSGGGPGQGGDGGADPGPDTSGSTPDLQVRPTSVYSGFDQTHTFRIPIAVYGAGKDLKVTLSDPSAATIEPAALKDPKGDDGKWYILTVKKVGQTSFTATAGGQSAQSSIHVVDYGRDRYAAGEKRYLNADGTKPACTKCHGGQDGIDHSPAALASVEDNRVETVITTGQRISGGPIPDVEQGHRWDPSEDQLAGLVTYLRALPPKNFVGIQ
ncbi:hypothetical protein [Pendulispora albinea]|uniref:Cytochrome c domain-containing protein n=1 Tax=Pendulispora albinea TaxID=2741071 RepID=A0ABZ2LTT9_9BACT